MKNVKTYEDYTDGITLLEYLDKNYHGQDLSKITKFDISYTRIKDLIGIDNLINLDTLHCHNNKLSNLKGIEKLTKLRGLSCNNNNITSLEGIENLKNLIDLNCRRNLLTTLDGVENLTNCENIDCEKNKLTSVKGVDKLNFLVLFDCSNNPKISWFDYIDKNNNIYYVKLPKSIEYLYSDEFNGIDEYWEWFDKNQPVAVSRKFNF